MWLGRAALSPQLVVEKCRRSTASPSSRRWPRASQAQLVNFVSLILMIVDDKARPTMLCVRDGASCTLFVGDSTCCLSVYTAGAKTMTRTASAGEVYLWFCCPLSVLLTACCSSSSAAHVFCILQLQLTREYCLRSRSGLRPQGARGRRHFGGPRYPAMYFKFGALSAALASYTFTLSCRWKEKPVACCNDIQ